MATRKKKNPVGAYQIYAPENKKYMEHDFTDEKEAYDHALQIFNLTGVPLEVHHNGSKIAKIGSNRKTMRGKNPVKPHMPKRQQQVIQAIQLFERFRLSEPKFVDEIEIERHDVLMKIGIVNAIEYDTVRNGKKEFYRHEFTGKSRPDLAASFDGKQLYILGGHYNFKAEGIVDFDPLTGKDKL
jgi:hypothetical protein